MQAIAVLVVLALGGAAAEAAPRERACSFGAVRARCFSLRVPLDRGGYVIGTVRLKGARVPARGGRRRSRKGLIALAGGPGQAALPFTADFAVELKALARTRDLLVIDQRGTGESGRLRCSSLEHIPVGESTSIAAAGCAAHLGPKRRSYTTLDTVADLDAIRAAYGYRKLALYGVSYGTYVAAQYARMHPDRVERLVLDAIVPPAGIDPLYLDGLSAAERLLADLCRRGHCSAIADLTRLLDRIGDGALRAPSYEGGPRPLTREARAFDLFGIIAAGDFDPSLRAALPAALHNAVAGDHVPLVRLVHRSRALGGPGYRRRQAEPLGYNALFAATICEEAPLPWPQDSPFADRARLLAIRLDYLLFGAWSRATVLQSDIAGLCYRWPASEPRLATPAPPPTLPDVPALLLNGTRDVRTPLAGARAIAAELPRAVLLTEPVGHGVLSSCRHDPIADWLRGRRRPRCRAVSQTAPLVDFPRTVDEAARARGIAGRRGRAVTVALLAMQESAVAWFVRARATDDADPVVGGLRGGRVRARGGAIALDRVGFTTDLRVSGQVTERGATLRLRGAPAISGSLRLDSHGRVRGRLGGRRVAGRPSNPPAV